jgi:hypothetical protein
MMFGFDTNKILIVITSVQFLDIALNEGIIVFLYKNIESRLLFFYIMVYIDRD